MGHIPDREGKPEGATMPSFLNITPELRLMLYEAVLNDMEKKIYLTQKGKPAAHPLSRVCHQLQDEFTGMYYKHAVLHAEVIRAKIYDYDFDEFHYLLGLPILPNHTRRREISFRISLQAPETHQWESVERWIQHCRENRKVHSLHSSVNYTIFLAAPVSQTSTLHYLSSFSDCAWDRGYTELWIAAEETFDSVVENRAQ